MTERSPRILMVLAALALAAPAQAQSTKDRLIRLQTQVEALQQQMTAMQQRFDERMGVMRTLTEQSTDNITKMSAAVTRLEKTLTEQSTQQSERTEQVSQQVQALHDSLDELKARVGKVAEQLDAMEQARANIGVAPATPPADAPPPDVLYNNALRDYTAGRLDLASQQFTDYMRFYPTTELAGNAQFYLADIDYRQGNYQRAIEGYDFVLDKYPGGNKTRAAMLKKGFALVELGQKDAGVTALRELIKRYPRSVEATSARDRLRKLGVAAR
ncbi:MAG TPA: tetratricopeptide repeat protein [Terriglobales bacterium]|nr:tetratricopeptide repeat protein [Terriglobales bacterium]